VNGIDAMRDTATENRVIRSCVEKFAVLFVSDRGPGIPEGKLKEVFEPFFIDIALRSRPLALRRIADKLLDSAEQGDLHAAREVIDRLDGRAVQSVDYSGAPVTELTDSQLYEIAGHGLTRKLPGAERLASPTEGFELVS
jgi:hypothetical protein